MNEPVLLIPILSSFFVTLILSPLWMKKARDIGLTWEDMNKIGVKNIPGSGGIAVLIGFIAGVSVYIAYRVFYLGSKNDFLVEVFALLTVIILLGGIGFIDDLMGWKRGGLNKKSRIFFAALAAVPLIAINAGRSVISFPVVGNVDLGLIYPLVLVPLGIVGASTTFNFLAGFNGLETGNGIILLSGVAFVAYFSGSTWVALICICMIASLFAFLIFNFYPAKLFPGDALTYSVGGLIAASCIIGNFEKIAVFFFIPVILEVFLKGRGGFKRYSFGKPSEDGSLAPRYEKIYGLTHLSIFLMQKYSVKPTEKRVVFAIWAFQLSIILIGILLFQRGIFS